MTTDAHLEAQAHREAQIRDGLTTSTTRPGDYRPGDHLRDAKEPDERSGRDELEAILPRPTAPLPVQDDIVIACPHEADDRNCRRCSDWVYGTAAPVIATAKRERRAA